MLEPADFEEPEEYSAALSATAAAAGIKAVRFFAWRDLDDPDAGGSEVYVEHIAQRWANAGLEVSIRTSAIAGGGQPQAVRGTVSATRRGSRYGVFARAGVAHALRRTSKVDAIVEVWNGVPFMSPLWFRGPRLTMLHHVHTDMWPLMLPGPIAKVGASIETSIAPRFYRRGIVSTLAESSKVEIQHKMRWPADKIRIAEPGVSRRYSPDGRLRSATPLVVAVGRLAPAKQFDQVIEAVHLARRHVPDISLVIIGEGQQRQALQAQIASIGAQDYIDLVGHVSDEDLLLYYRRAWAVASLSLAEGWGMTLTEAAACATPAIVSNISGHSDAVVDGSSGYLVTDAPGMAQRLADVFADAGEMNRLRQGALARAEQLSWGGVAEKVLASLAEAALISKR